MTSTGEVVIFVYDLEGQLLGEYDQTGQAIREYVWRDNIPVAMFMPDPANASGPPLIYYIHADHLNAPRVVVDQSGAKRWRWIAEPFGTTAPETNPEGLGVFTQNLRFPGQYADAESGLWYNYFRFYAADVGAYRQSDPIGLAGGSLSTYAYVDASPLDMVDPNGEFGITGALWGAGIDLGFQLLMNGGRLQCVNWKDVGLAAVGGALTGGLLNGIGKIKKGANTWDATRKGLNVGMNPVGLTQPRRGSNTIIGPSSRTVPSGRWCPAQSRINLGT